MKSFRLKGFTIVELLVVIFIITTLTGFSVIYYRRGEKQLTLQRTVNKIMQDIRRVQEMAMSAKKCPAGVSCTSASRYGIYFKKNSSSYFLFIDLDGNGVYLNEVQDYLLEEIKLEGKTIIEEVSIDTGFKNQVFITFLPPDPLTIIKHDAGNNTFFSSTIKITQEGKSKRIEVNKFGLIASD